MSKGHTDAVGTHDDTTRVVEFLRGRDMACPSCGYNLRDAAKPVCSECGTHITVGLIQSDPGLGAWAASLVFLAMGLGFDAVMTVVLLIGLVFAGPVGQPVKLRGTVVIGVFVVLSVSITFAALQVYRGRERWKRMTPRGRTLSATTIFAVMLVIHSTIGLLIGALL